MEPDKHPTIGNPERRVDGWGKVTGAAKYAADYSLPRQLFGRVLRSKHPHARIVSIDTAIAAKLHGVEAVLTAKDIPGARTFGSVVKNQEILAGEKARYLGEGIALVAARSWGIAEEALRLIHVVYEPMPVVSDPELAMWEDAPRIHPEGNVFVHHKIRKGNIEKGFAASDFVIQRRFRTQFVDPSALEPEAVLAEPDEHGGVNIVGSIENVFSCRRAVASALNLDLNRVHMTQATLGGSFGGKDDVMASMCCRAALLARATGRPVKIVNTREESMLEGSKRHPFAMYYRWGAKNNGAITAMEIRCVGDGGAYGAMSPSVALHAAVHATGPYACENVKTDLYGVYTNNNYTCAMVGVGSPQVNFAVESMMDEIAERAGMDPLEIRLRNFFRRGSLTATGQRLDHEVSLREVLQKAADGIGFPDKWNKFREASEGTHRSGVGLSCGYRGVSLGGGSTDAAEAVVSVQTDGSVIVSSGITDAGEGTGTLISQIVAAVLGIPVGKILFLNSDTHRVADSGPALAARGTIMGGSAAKNAAEIVRATFLDVAAAMSGSSPRDLLLENGYVVKSADRSRVASFVEVAAECFEKGRPMHGIGWHRAPKTSWDESTGSGEPHFTFVYAASAAEVVVDAETGKVDVKDIVCVSDVGTAVNRDLVKGQMIGGVAMGLGYGLLEEFSVEEGIPARLNFDEYLIPTSMDVPPVRTVVVENGDAAGPFGAKSSGEQSGDIVAPAIVNAIFNATGKRITDLPASLERVHLGHALRGPVAQGSTPEGADPMVPDLSCKIRPGGA
ncbi:MAG TPA: xanthine dehydrogenase family protein molybdopterin-binding subunit [Bacteroidota bacterium]|nr:xanthine dehydrogenase family protein molybdopterin-binding subunit [Bacteroidota bacterium]